MQICDACARANPGTYRLCGYCGTELVPGGPAPEIRRTVTFVTSDLKGSTALAERLDPESLREALVLYFNVLQLVLESHGGTVEKIVGDAIIAVFGLPVAGEHDALHAVQAAAETQTALALLNDDLDRRWKVRLVNRTGIATGEAVVGIARAGEHILTGDVVQLANALEQSAPPNEILIGESTLRLVADHVTTLPVDPVVPKGGLEPVPAYQLVAVGGAAEHPEPDEPSATHEERVDARTCPNCGVHNPLDFRGCGACGTALTGKVSHEASGRAPRRDGRGRRSHLGHRAALGWGGPGRSGRSLDIDGGDGAGRVRFSHIHEWIDQSDGVRGLPLGGRRLVGQPRAAEDRPSLTRRLTGFSPR